MLKFLLSLFGSSKIENDYRIYAQTEYGEDWKYAYSQLKMHGHVPRINGVTL